MPRCQPAESHNAPTRTVALAHATAFLPRALCGPARALQEYAAVVVLDGSMEVIGDTSHLTSALHCAAQGKVLTVSAPNAPLDAGMLVLAPSKNLQFAALNFLSDELLANGSLWASSGSFPKGECAAELLWALLREPSCVILLVLSLSLALSLSLCGCARACVCVCL